MLAISAVLPFSRIMRPLHGHQLDETVDAWHSIYIWSSDRTGIGIVLLPLVFLWPVGVLVLKQRAGESLAEIAIRAAEPILALISFLYCCGIAFAEAFGASVASWRTPEWHLAVGWYVAVVGIGAYLSTWVTDVIVAIRARRGRMVA